MVERLAALLVSREEVARDFFLLPICRDTLRRHFAASLTARPATASSMPPADHCR